MNEGEPPRRQRLLQAATNVLAANGLRGLTHRAVDKQARFPEGTCSVSFRTRAALLAGVTTFVGERLAHDVRAMGEVIRCEGSDDPLASVPAASVLLERWTTEDDGAYMLAILELSIEAVRTPDLAPAVGEWRSELITIVESIVARTGRADARLRAETVVASLQGIVLSALAAPRDARGLYLEQNLRQLLLGTAAD